MLIPVFRKPKQFPPERKKSARSSATYLWFIHLLIVLCLLFNNRCITVCGSRNMSEFSCWWVRIYWDEKNLGNSSVFRNEINIKISNVLPIIGNFVFFSCKLICGRTVGILPTEHCVKLCPSFKDSKKLFLLMFQLTY